MSLTRQQRRAINRKAAHAWVSRNAKEHNARERKAFERQLVDRLNHELPRSAYESESERSRIIAPDDSPLVLPAPLEAISYTVVNPMG